MDLSRKTEWDKPTFLLFLLIFLHNLLSKTLLLLCQNTEVLNHVAATFVFVLLEEHPLNAVVNSFSRKFL
jgi:hypothetical protein